MLRVNDSQTLGIKEGEEEREEEEDEIGPNQEAQEGATTITSP